VSDASPGSSGSSACRTALTGHGRYVGLRGDGRRPIPTTAASSAARRVSEAVNPIQFPARFPASHRDGLQICDFNDLAVAGVTVPSAPPGLSARWFPESGQALSRAGETRWYPTWHPACHPWPDRINHLFSCAAARRRRRGSEGSATRTCLHPRNVGPRTPRLLGTDPRPAGRPSPQPAPPRTATWCRSPTTTT